ncbi:hypothetical protein LLG96_00765, partial [bacterium]|nr:hypothetical protein [bacterium]
MSAEHPRIDLMLNLAKPAARPTIGTTLGTSVLSSGGHFRVHYDTTGTNMPELSDKNSNSIPDYIDSVLVYLEYAWNIEINEFGFALPPSDGGTGGGNEIDVYIKNFGTGAYGAAYPEKVEKNYTCYMVIDNDFSESQYYTKGYNALRVTTANVLSLAIEYGYLDTFDMMWWMQQSAVWMENRVWDDVNDYLGYIHFFFDEQNKSLDNSDGIFMFGAVVWPMYLSKRFGDSILRELWEKIGNTGEISIDTFDDVIPIGLASAYHEFAVWNYFTGDRANTRDFYREGDLFSSTVGMAAQYDTLPAADSLSTPYLTSRYIELSVTGELGEGDALDVRVTPNGTGTFKSSVVLYNDPYDYEIHTLSSEQENIALHRTWDKAVLVTSCTNTSGDSYSYNYEVKKAENAPPVTLADTPWPMRGQNLQHTGRGIATVAASSTVKWKFQSGGIIKSSPAIGADGTVY